MQTSKKRRRSDFIPYRDSVLTWLLRENLGTPMHGRPDGLIKRLKPSILMNSLAYPRRWQFTHDDVGHVVTSRCEL